MGSVDRRPNGKYRARYRDATGRQLAKHFDKKSDAQRWLTRVEASKLDGTYVNPAAGRQTFGEYAESWLSRQVHRPTTDAQVRSHLKNHILPQFANCPIGSIRRWEVQSFVKTIGTRLAPSTVEVVFRYLSSIFLSAVEDRIIVSSPSAGVKLPKRERRLVNPLTTEQVRALVDAVPDRYQALVLCAAGSGLRQGELFGLTLAHVNVLHKEIRVEQQLVQVSGEPQFGPPKTEASRRVVPIPALLVEAISSHLSKYGHGDEGLVFTDDDGRPLVGTASHPPSGWPP